MAFYNSFSQGLLAPSPVTEPNMAGVPPMMKNSFMPEKMAFPAFTSTILTPPCSPSNSGRNSPVVPNSPSFMTVLDGVFNDMPTSLPQEFDSFLLNEDSCVPDFGYDFDVLSRSTITPPPEFSLDSYPASPESFNMSVVPEMDMDISLDFSLSSQQVLEDVLSFEDFFVPTSPVYSSMQVKEEYLQEQYPVQEEQEEQRAMDAGVKRKARKTKAPASKRVRKTTPKATHTPKSKKAALASAAPRHMTESELAEKRDSHNVSERMRRKDLKNSFHDLRTEIPEIKDNSRVHTGQILKHAIDYIAELQRQDAEFEAAKAALRAENARLRALAQ